MTSVKNKIILDLCGGSGAWSAPYWLWGYDVRVIDPAAGTGDVRLLERLPGKVYGILAAPPCTVFASSGAWIKRADSDFLAALAVVDACLRIVWAHRPHFWALENPVGRLASYLGPPRFYFNPCDFGDPWLKKTALWGRFNPPVPYPVPPAEGSKMLKYAPGPDRAQQRSVTPFGFAMAFFRANQ